MIPDEVVDQVRDAADIVQIVGEYVNLKRAGADFRGPCPFHQGTHRNFSVSPKKRMYYCFVCHEGGDVFRFLQKRLGVEWPAAVKMVGEKSGIEVREVDTRREGPDPREPLWEMNATAASYFQKILWDDPLGGPAREYLAQRDISREVADQFGIGFAPREIGLLRNYMATLGFDESRLARVAIRMSANAKSAVASVRTPGVLLTTTPRRAHSGTSTLSYPTAAFATMRSPEPAASTNASSTRSWRSVTTPSAPATAACSSSVASGRSWARPISRRACRISCIPIFQLELTNPSSLARRA